MKSKIKIILPIALVLALFLAFSLLIHLNSHVFFVWFEKSGIFLDPVDVSEVDGGESFKKYNISELKEDERFTFDQSMMLVNTEHMLSEGFVPDVLEYKDTDVFMSKCMLEAYACLSADILEKFDKKLYVSSDFRSAEEQEQLYLDDPLTATKVGASEHQTGLALDVYVAYYAGDGFIKSPVGRFVNSECHKYGFIIRYPSFGEDVTGIRFEPWHIRYVGLPHANIIYNNHLTLEEYVLSLEIGQWYEVDGYLYCRQAAVDGELTLPESFESCTVSPDNTGYYIVTIEK